MTVISTLLSFIPVLLLVLSLAALVLLPPAIGLIVRRMNDIGQVWWMGILPFYDLYLAAQPGEVGANAYGADPLLTDTTVETVVEVEA